VKRGSSNARRAPNNEGWTFHVAAIVLTLLTLFPIWSNRFLGLKDYSQHLFDIYVASTYNDPSLDWAEHFRLDNPIAPYRLTSFAVRALAAITGVEMAGKLFLSVYLLVVLLLVYRLRAWAGSERNPWTTLLLFPLAFHQMYFFGFLNFDLSIPLLVLVLVDLEVFASRPLTARSILRQAMLCLALFFVHPFTALVYVPLSSVRALVLLRDRAMFLRAIMPPIALSVLCGTWLVVSRWGEPSSALSIPVLRWWTFAWQWRFFALLFSGMRITKGPAVLPLLLWAGVAVLIAASAYRNRAELRIAWPFALLFFVTTVGFFVVPFSVQFGVRYAFFGTRLVPICYFLLVVALVGVPMRPWAGRVLALLCVALLVLSSEMQARLSQETATIVPIVVKMKRNAAVLPLISRSDSSELDPLFYAQFHYGDIFYYHLLIGGGVSPDLFDNDLMLARSREGKRPPRPAQGALWLSPEYLAHYDYIISRGLPTHFENQLQTTCTLLAQSGEWRLYEIPHRGSRSVTSGPTAQQ
jgi:hypothetical protein